MDLDKEELKATKGIKNKTAHDMLVERGYTPVMSKRGKVFWRGENYIGVDDFLKLIHIHDVVDTETLKVICKLCEEEGITK